ncbi:MBL fold metallo-hydrolase [Marinibactrum halimedae]|uniref:Metallo-beta-lactamase domain-containing protein n=1 Tax=Marinibactrum halimedae TaxID=1444977 RepID=A0AA37T750_9GAMM|nr:MBL fold metallo-hydrolase [Marinibactrum halimedae]MCD9459842.1 MBL fold metallo-hydrolase [Marinibactrum halimedae]GLS26964.1 hypothetical protein GCM10007877_26830 [Marinibactrum halimedae]
MNLEILFYGQVGFFFKSRGANFLIDPYFSHSVEEKEDRSIKRLLPVFIKPESLTDIDFVLITHAHRDHCDPDTLLPLAKSSPQCHFYGPAPVFKTLKNAGIDSERLHIVGSDSICIKGVNIHPVPSAHPLVNPDEHGGWCATGYVFEVGGGRYYHPGDTAVAPEVIEAVKATGPIDVGMIPVNEINYYRNRENIIGNMSLREAFQFAEDIGVTTFIPTHWDMFAKNQVYREEIELLYTKITPSFELKIMEAGSSIVS